MTKKYMMGLDCGLTNSKAVLFDLEGKQLASASRSFETSHPHPGWVQASPETLWENAATCIKETIAKAGIDAEEIASIACCGFGCGLFFLGDDGISSYPALGSNDARTIPTQMMLEAESGAEFITMTGSSYSSCHAPVIVRYLKDNDPEAYAKTTWYCQCKDFLKFHLTGVKSADPSDAALAACMDLRDPSKLEYSPRIFELAGVPEAIDKFAPISDASSSIVGYVTEKAAAETGLAVGTPVGSGMVDINACMMGVGVVDESKAVAIMGTWSINEVIGPEVKPGVTLTGLYDLPGMILSCNGGPTSATNMEWFVNEVAVGIDLLAKEKGVNKFQMITDAAATIPAGGTSVLYLPFFGTPNVHARGRAGFSNIAYGCTFADMCRALLEGICYDHKRHLYGLKEKGAPYTVVRLAGGGAKNPFWAQMMCDILDMPVEVVETEELGAFGAAVSSAKGVGIFADYESALSKTVKIRATYTPNPEATAAYNKRYDSWMAMVNAMIAAWDKGDIATE